MNVKSSRSRASVRRPLPRYSRYPVNGSVQYGQLPKRAAEQSEVNWRRRFQVILACCLTLLVASHVVWTKHVSAEQAASVHNQAVIAAQDSAKAAVFVSQVNALIAQNPTITLSISVMSSTGGLQQYGGNSEFDGASTAKLITAADYLHQIELGRASLRQTIDGQSARSLLQKMIVNSDDSAWADLNDYLTHADLSRYASGLGIRDYDADANTFSSNDIATLLQKLSSGTLLNPANSQLLLNYMKQANYRDFMVPAIPLGYTIYHKVGLDNDTVNEAAIITRGNSRLVLVIFTDGNGTYDWDGRARIIQTITKDALTAYLSN